MTWQEPVVAIIVGLAVVSLYRHLRSMLRMSKPSSDASCHGCESCDDGSEPTGTSPNLGASERRS